MIRRWSIPLATLALVFGSMLGAATAASASPVAHSAAAHPASAQGFKPGGPMIRPKGAHSETVNGHTTDQSTNWSGYAATGGSGSFNSVSASWTEPAASCSSDPDSFASFWVGLDGFNSSSVEQTGTDSDCSGTSPDYYGWYEMYPAAPVNFDNPVAPGDSMSASVTFSGTETYTLVLTDNTQGWTQPITQNESGLDRSSAEVITEAPSSESGVLPLADFGTINYSVSGANGASLDGQDPTQIIMVDGNGQQQDSTSSIGGGGAFGNAWLQAS